LNGITPRLIESHYEGNYGSALRRLNAITEELEALDPATASIEVINRLKRDEREETDVLPSPADLL
jgi:Fe-Mn family superoxide dismutase